MANLLMLLFIALVVISLITVAVLAPWLINKLAEWRTRQTIRHALVAQELLKAELLKQQVVNEQLKSL